MNSQEQLVKRHFASIAHIYGKQYQDCSPAGHFFTTRLKKVYELLGDIRGAIVLDVGCGPGIPASYLVSRDCEYFGVDLVHEMLLECRSISGCSESVRLQVGNMKRLPFRNSSFDVVLCLGALEYLENVNFGIRELSRVVNKNGTVIVSMQNKLSPYRLWDHYGYRSNLINRAKKALRRPTAERTVLNLFNGEYFRDLLTNNQLRVRDIVYYDYNLWLPPLDRYFPRLSVAISDKLEFLHGTALRSLGTGFIVKAEKVA